VTPDVWISSEERGRRDALQRLDLLNPEPDPFFDDLIDLVQKICGAPIALVSLTDVDRQWFKVKRGIDLPQVPRGGSLCAHVVESGRPLMIGDAQTHPLSHDSPLVTGATHIRAYAGTPIILSDGNRIGTVCALDTSAHIWDDQSAACLQRAARMVASHAETRAAYGEAVAANRLTAERAASVAREQSIINALSEGVVVHGTDGSIIECNEAACQILGLTEDQLRGRTSRDPRWMATDEDGTPLRPDQHPAMIVRATGRASHRMVMGINRPDGETRFLIVSAVPLFTGGVGVKPQALATFVDITNQIRQQRQLNDLREKAEADSRAKSEFLAALSHEIRTPLNGLLGVSQHLARNIIDPGLKLRVELLRRSGMALKAIVDDALDIDRIELGGFPLRLAAFDLRELLSEIALMHEPAAHERRLVLNFACNAPDPCILIADEGRIRQILNNLVSNAVKFTASGSVSVVASVTSREPPGCNLLIEVSDTGRGISPDFAETLFAKFARQHEKEETDGSGLGLYLATKLARLMGGNLSYRANQPSGAIFTLTVPLEFGEIGAGVAHPEIAQETGPLRILIVEDHAVNRQVFSILLEPFDVTITFVGDGRAALEAVRQDTFDLILMDRQLPDMNGVDVTLQLRASERERRATRMPILFVSANGSPSAIQEATEAGADGYVTKPILLDTLMQEINRVVLASRQGAVV
jgi:PAS domain S-box-containing protein